KNGSTDSLVNAEYTFEGSDGHTRTLRITAVLFRSEGIVDRMSVVLEVICICSDAEKCGWRGRSLVLKVSFPGVNREPEDKLIAKARSIAQEKKSAYWALNHLPDLLDSITFVYKDDTPQAKLREHSKAEGITGYEERAVHVATLEKLETLNTLTSTKDYAQIFYDILQIHRWLYEEAKILHRDLSPGNIMLRRTEDKIYGVLNDFDLASSIPRTGAATSNQRTGTRPYMALDLLDDDSRYFGHMYRHDLESLFYIILCFACRYEAPGKRCRDPPFSKWFAGTDADILGAKNKFITRGQVSAIPIQHHFRFFEPWLEAMFLIIRRGYRNQAHDQDNRNQGVEFDQETLGGELTYQKVKTLMTSYNGEALETRWT
ncbi:hypothetical protein BDP27DRAFT_1230692, partial [Rhodocollybia butyracea]